MDIALCIIDTQDKTLQFSGAYNPLYLVRNGDIEVLKADRMPIGIHRKKTKSFTKTDISLQNDDIVYLFSDGFPDQFGGEKGGKYMQNNFRQLLLDIHKNPMKEQYQVLENELLNWRGDTPQTDDVLIIGLKFNI
jgi:serine phosphatase RsbU (regulator of sigma subunit)